MAEKKFIHTSFESRVRVKRVPRQESYVKDITLSSYLQAFLPNKMNGMKMVARIFFTNLIKTLWALL